MDKRIVLSHLTQLADYYDNLTEYDDADLLTKLAEKVAEEIKKEDEEAFPQKELFNSARKSMAQLISHIVKMSPDREDGWDADWKQSYPIFKNDLPEEFKPFSKKLFNHLYDTASEFGLDYLKDYAEELIEQVLEEIEFD